MTNNNLEDLRRKAARFLNDFRNLMDKKPCRISKHYKNDQTTRRLGLTLRNCEDVIYALTPVNYYTGPNVDKLHKGNYWEFGTEINGDPIYIKLKIATNKFGDDYPVCYSFHDPERALTFPLRKKT